jgi:hypothetical protein
MMGRDEDIEERSQEIAGALLLISSFRNDGSSPEERLTDMDVIICGLFSWDSLILPRNAFRWALRAYVGPLPSPFLSKGGAGHYFDSVGMSDPLGHFVLFCKVQKGGLEDAKRSPRGIQSPIQIFCS